MTIESRARVCLCRTSGLIQCVLMLKQYKSAFASAGSQCDCLVRSDALLNARMSEATAHNVRQSATLPLICSNKGATLFVIFFFPHSFLFTRHACWNLSRKKKKKQKLKKKNKQTNTDSEKKKKKEKKQQHSPYIVTTCQLHSLIIQETSHHVNMPLRNGSWSCAADFGRKPGFAPRCLTTARLDPVERCRMIPNSRTASALFCTASSQTRPFPTRTTRVLAMSDASN